MRRKISRLGTPLRGQGFLYTAAGPGWYWGVLEYPKYGFLPRALQPDFTAALSATGSGGFQPPRPDGVAGADAELRGKWVLKGESALVDSSSPRHGDKASYYTAVCLETGEEEWMELEGNSNGESSVAFLERLRGRHGGRLGVIWDNAPAPLRQAQEGSSDAVISGDPRP